MGNKERAREWWDEWVWTGSPSRGGYHCRRCMGSFGDPLNRMREAEARGRAARQAEIVALVDAKIEELTRTIGEVRTVTTYDHARWALMSMRDAIERGEADGEK